MHIDLNVLLLPSRGTIDILIALIAMENKLVLLHNDHDFDLMAEHLDNLNILIMI